MTDEDVYELSTLERDLLIEVLSVESRTHENQYRRDRCEMLLRKLRGQKLRVSR